MKMTNISRMFASCFGMRHWGGGGAYFERGNTVMMNCGHLFPWPAGW